MPLECDGKEILEFKGIYLQKAFASKIKRQIPYTKVTKFLPLNSRGNLCNSVFVLITVSAYYLCVPSRVSAITLDPFTVDGFAIFSPVFY